MHAWLYPNLDIAANSQLRTLICVKIFKMGRSHMVSGIQDLRRASSWIGHSWSVTAGAERSCWCSYKGCSSRSVPACRPRSPR